MTNGLLRESMIKNVRCTARLLRKEFFGPDGQPVLCEDGFARLTLQHDEQGNLIQFDFFLAEESFIYMQIMVAMQGTGCKRARKR